MEIQTRPYTICFSSTGSIYPISSDEVRTLAENYPECSHTITELILRADDGQRVSIRPATLGGGAAFLRASLSDDSDLLHRDDTDAQEAISEGR